MLDVAPVSDRSFQSRSFSSARGGAEHYIAITSPPGLCIEDALDYIERARGRQFDLVAEIHLHGALVIMRRASSPFAPGNFLPEPFQKGENGFHEQQRAAEFGVHGIRCATGGSRPACGAG